MLTGATKKTHEKQKSYHFVEVMILDEIMGLFFTFQRNIIFR